MIRGEEIKTLIPQRFPMMMVDEFEAGEGRSAFTALTVRSDNYFLLFGQELSETGLIEHFAQSCSALAGYEAIQQGVTNPPVGMIAEVKHFTCKQRPRKGERIDTFLSFDFAFGSMILAKGHCSIGTEQIAELELKIFIQ